MAEDEVVEACRFDHCVPARENIMAGRADVEVLRLSSIPRRDGLRPCTSERHGERCSRRCLIEPIEHEVPGDSRGEATIIGASGERLAGCTDVGGFQWDADGCKGGGRIHEEHRCDEQRCQTSRGSRMSTCGRRLHGQPPHLCDVRHQCEINGRKLQAVYLTRRRKVPAGTRAVPFSSERLAPLRVYQFNVPS